MRVMLRRDMFLNNTRYRRSRYGTEIPDEFDERLSDGTVLHKKVVFFKPKTVTNEETGVQREVMDYDQRKQALAGELVVLPRDAKPYEGDEKDEPRGTLIRNQPASPQVAVSELNKSEQEKREEAAARKSK